MKALFISKPLKIEPLGMMYISASAKKAGHETRLALTTEDLEGVVDSYKPDVVAYSVMTGDQNFYNGINKNLKRRKSFHSCFGGPHPTFFQDFVKEEGVDSICIGEGEGAFVDLLDFMQSGRGIREIPNLGFNDGGKARVNKPRTLANIDGLPFPDRELIASVKGVGDGPIKHFIAGRGCPFDCSYCFNGQYRELYKGNGKAIRFRDPALVVDEIKEVVDASPTRFVYFQDDTFTLNPGWLKKFCGEYAQRVDLPYHCHVRPNTINADNAKMLQESGCYSVHIAAESGNDRLRNEILGRGMSKEQIISASRNLREAGIKFMLQNIIGIPTGTIENDIETLELNIECAPDYAWVSIFQPYPGTNLSRFSQREGIYAGDYTDIGNNFFDESRLNFSKEYKAQLKNLQKIFAIIVEYPELHKLGLSRALIDSEDNPKTRERYTRAYTEFRNKADERLFGFKL